MWDNTTLMIYNSTTGRPIVVDAIDCTNIAKVYAMPIDDPDYWPFRPGGFRETVLLLMLAGF